MMTDSTQQDQQQTPQDQPAPDMEQPITEDEAPTIQLSKKLQEFIISDNIAEGMDDKKLIEIGTEVVDNTKIDDDSRKDWKDQLDKALKIAKQIIEERTLPWPKASNSKLPLILTGCIQFNSRVFPQLKQGSKVVKIQSLKSKPSEADVERAKDLSAHMSYQLLSDDGDWIDQKDKLLMLLPLLGTLFTKVYHDPIEQKQRVDLCLPDEVIVNQHVKTLSKAQRVTQIIWLDTNDVITRQRNGMFLDIPVTELSALQSDSAGSAPEEANISRPSTMPGEKIDEEELNSGSALHKFQEQLCYLDLDDDDYAEPYIVTVHEATKKVMRIVAGYDEDSFVMNKTKTEWIKIIPNTYFNVYKFLPSFDNTFYGMGFSQILYPINAAANSVLNRLLDAGTLSNMQSGFIGKGVRMNKQTMRLRPGEWTTVSTASGVDLSRNIVPIPTKEPSNVLFELLGTLMKAAQEISGVSDVMQGQLPPANTPATTVVNMISEGSKVFSAIRIRLDNALQKEYQMVFKLTKDNLDTSESFFTAERSGQVTREDYLADDYGIMPVANAAMGTEAKELAVMQGLMSLKDDPILNKQEIYMRFFSAMNVPDPDKLFAPPPPPNAPPPPEIQQILTEIKYTNMKIADLMTDIEEKGIALDLKEKDMLIRAEDVASLAAERKINSMNEIEQLRQSGRQQDIDAAKEEVDKIVEESTPDVKETEPQIQHFEQTAGQASGLEPPPQQASPGSPEQQGSSPGGAGQGLIQSLADRMEQTVPSPEKPVGGERLPLGEPK